jgi:hypothetical protein
MMAAKYSREILPSSGISSEIDRTNSCWSGLMLSCADGDWDSDINLELLEIV